MNGLFHAVSPVSRLFVMKFDTVHRRTTPRRRATPTRYRRAVRKSDSGVSLGWSIALAAGLSSSGAVSDVIYPVAASMRVRYCSWC